MNIKLQLFVIRIILFFWSSKKEKKRNQNYRKAMHHGLPLSVRGKIPFRLVRQALSPFDSHFTPGSLNDVVRSISESKPSSRFPVEPPSAADLYSDWHLRSKILAPLPLSLFAGPTRTRDCLSDDICTLDTGIWKLPIVTTRTPILILD